MIDKSTCFLLGFAAGSIIAVCVITASFNTYWEQDCIKHGAAHYVITDPKTGKVEFRWKDEAKP